LPLTIGAIQTLIVAILSLIIGLVFEDFIWSNILKEKFQILYAGILSGGLAFVLQIYAQKNISPAPSAIIFLRRCFCNNCCMDFIDQILDINNLLGCLFILFGVLFSQLAPILKKINYILLKVKL